MSKLLVICGPTAVGKTGLALRIAMKFQGEIVSADSRQVYRGMDIGTGKGLEEIEKSEVKVWGYDLVDPWEKFSVAQYGEVGRGGIKDILERKKKPILVGGTGLYIKAIVDGIETLEILPDFELRRKFKLMDVERLYRELERIDPEKARKLNNSDRKNSRRLIRAIEIAGAQEKPVKGKKRFQGEVLMIGLGLERKRLFERIEMRVGERVNKGVEGEIGELLRRGVSWKDQSMQALGYRQWRGYFEGGLTREQVIGTWIKMEQRYAKRQMTWFRKDERIEWFDLEDKDWAEKVEERVEKWYF